MRKISDKRYGKLKQDWEKIEEEYQKQLNEKQLKENEEQEKAKRRMIFILGGFVLDNFENTSFINKENIIHKLDAKLRTPYDRKLFKLEAAPRNSEPRDSSPKKRSRPKISEVKSTPPIGESTSHSAEEQALNTSISDEGAVFTIVRLQDQID